MNVGEIPPPATSKDERVFHFASPAGRGQLDVNGATWINRLGREVRIPWKDVTRIRWTRGGFTVSNRAQQARFTWLYIASPAERGPAEWLVRDALRGFDLTCEVVPRPSIRRILWIVSPLLVLFAIACPLALSAHADAEASTAYKMFTAILLMGPMFVYMLIGPIVLMLQRDKAKSPYRWRTRAP